MDLKENFPLTVDLVEDSTRVDQLLSQRFPAFSRSRWKHLIDAALFKADGKILKSSSKLRSGQIIEVDAQAAGELLRQKTVWEIRKFKGTAPEIIFENKNYLVINKPAGLAVHPGAGIEPEDTLVAWLLESDRLKDVDPESRLAWGDSVVEDQRPGIVHRLDRGTSGALVIAKDPATHRFLAEQFENRSAGRIYLAVVKGSLDQSMNHSQSLFRKKLRDSATHMALHWNRAHKLGRFVSYLARDPIRRTIFKVEPGGVGRVASTDFLELSEFSPYSLLALKLGTGRTHQIRVHMNFFGLPIVGDGLYGGGRLNPNPVGEDEEDPMFLLHARCLYLKDPQTKEERSFDAPIPSHFDEFLKKSGLSDEEHERIVEMKWNHWNTIFHKVGVEA